MNIIKKFQEWFVIKQKIDEIVKYPKFREGEVWFCYLGENVGDEENGKGEKFLRPVIIVKKFNQRLFYAIPTSTKIKDNKYYYKIEIKGVEVSALLSQVKSLDVKRLSYKHAKLSDTDLLLIKKKISKTFLN